MHPSNFADLRKSSFSSEINLSWIRSPPFFFLSAFGPPLASALPCFLGWCDGETTQSSDISETVIWKGLRGSWQGQEQNCILWFLTQILGSACGHVCGFLFPLGVSKVYKQRYHLPGTEEGERPFKLPTQHRIWKQEVLTLLNEAIRNYCSWPVGWRHPRERTGSLGKDCLPKRDTERNKESFLGNTWIRDTFPIQTDFVLREGLICFRETGKFSTL